MKHITHPGPKIDWTSWVPLLINGPVGLWKYRSRLCPLAVTKFRSSETSRSVLGAIYNGWVASTLSLTLRSRVWFIEIFPSALQLDV